MPRTAPAALRRAASPPSRRVACAAKGQRRRRRERREQQQQQPPREDEDAQEAGGGGAAQLRDDGPPAAAAEARQEAGVPREAVLGAALRTSGAFVAAGVGGRVALGALGVDVLPLLPDGGAEGAAAAAGAAVGAAALVTAARLALLPAWPEFRAATDASNAVALRPLDGFGDLLVCAALPGVAEELLFRGLLLPGVAAAASGASLPGAAADAAGVAVSAAAFGALHQGGGRNAAFAGWAGGVGALYGAAALATGSCAAPALAHACANLLSAGIWLRRDAEPAGTARAPPS